MFNIIMICAVIYDYKATNFIQDILIKIGYTLRLNFFFKLNPDLIILTYSFKPLIRLLYNLYQGLLNYKVSR
jgi:hypothetical protein